ncbi:MAG TPA: hypothetical protein GYA10_01885 [Alphaproteobacteria bacterium]|nr:hypothetical protein [Alphaproteobacteria bacterium]
MSSGRLIRVEHSAAFLPKTSTLRRLPRRTSRPRPPEFFERYEDRALVYDCFWDAAHERILMVGPPPMNLAPHYRTARFEALPSRTELAAAYYPSLSTMITALAGAPQDTREIVMHLGEVALALPVRPNHSAEFAGRRILFTMSKDNDLAWIEEWARWHARLHGADAIVLFDNGSSRYTVDDIASRLLDVPEIERVVVESWPWRFGMTDPGVTVNAYWSHFLQISSMSVALRRYGMAASGLLNCDIDELAATRSGRSIYSFLERARHGLVVFRGQWVEAGAAGADHRAFVHRHRDPRRARSRQRKWVLDPTRPWVRRLTVHPYWHWVRGRPMFGKTMPADAFYRHFKAINTNWKEMRTTACDTAELEPDAALIADFARSGAHG